VKTAACACGKRMVLLTESTQILTYPMQQAQVWVCYGCGARKEGPIVRWQTAEEANRQAWESAQLETVWVGEWCTRTQTLFWTGEWVTAADRLEFVLSDNLQRALKFPDQDTAMAVLRKAQFWPRQGVGYTTKATAHFLEKGNIGEWLYIGEKSETS